MRRATLAVVALAVGESVILRLAAWQWERGRETGSLLHYTYAAEWVLVALALPIALVVRRRGRGRTDAEVASRDVHGRLIGPPLRPDEQLSETTGVRLRRRLFGRRLRKMNLRPHA